MKKIRGGDSTVKLHEVDAYLRAYTNHEKESLLRNIRRNAIQQKVSELMEDDAFLGEAEEIGIYKHDRFASVSEHYHNYIELTYVWEGIFVQHINGEELRCRKGDVCILNPKAVHSIERCGEDDIVINILMRKELFDYAFVGRLAGEGALAEFLIESVMERQSRSHYLLFHTEQTEGFHELIGRIVSEYYSEQLGKREVLKSYIVVMFTELLRTYNAAAKKKVKAERDAVVIRVLEYIEKNYEECSLTSASSVFGFHPAYLTAMLKEETGKSFIRHVHEQKLKKAKILLRVTEVPVTDIVTLCGYQNLSFFYKKFKEAEGVTPAVYREQNKRKAVT